MCRRQQIQQNRSRKQCDDECCKETVNTFRRRVNKRKEIADVDFRKKIAVHRGHINDFDKIPQQIPGGDKCGDPADLPLNHQSRHSE